MHVRQSCGVRTVHSGSCGSPAGQNPSSPAQPHASSRIKTIQNNQNNSTYSIAITEEPQVFKITMKPSIFFNNISAHSLTCDAAWNYKSYLLFTKLKNMVVSPVFECITFTHSSVIYVS